MADFTIDARQLRKLERSLTRAGKDYKKGVKRFLKEVGARVMALAKKYCPISPNKKQYESTLQDYTTSRANTSFTTGSLQNSITTELGKDQVSINVPSNSKGGKYGEKIHDKRGSEWQNLGIGSKRKGKDVGDKFIFRAYEDSEDKIDELIDKVINDMTKEIGV